MSRIRARLTAESGSVVVIVVASMFLLVLIAGLVLDLAAVRANRSSSQIITDAAASAAALELQEFNGVDACRAAVDYVTLNLDGVTGFPGIDCTTFPPSCTSATASVTAIDTQGDFTLRLEYPVEDGSTLMDPHAIGATTQAVSGEDGTRCERVGVELTSRHDTFFAKIAGVNDQTTSVHTVARSDSPLGDNLAVNLLILEQHECDAIEVSTSGGSGGVTVGAILDPATGERYPGLLAVDSDGTVGCGADGTMDLDGSNAKVRADGAPGCPSELSPGTGQGCGTIRLLAPGTPGCNFPACTSAGEVRPDPIALKDRLTRAPVDYRYNCKDPYPPAVGIPGCDDTPAPHIDDLVAAYGGLGVPAGFSSYSGAGYSCSPNSPLVVPAGNWFVDCNLSVTKDLIFSGGSVVFAGDVSVSSDAKFAINTVPVSLTSSTNAAVAYFRNGRLSKSGQASVIMHHTMAYFSPASEFVLTGGSGALVWTAPLTGPFEDLALWSDSALAHDMGGQAGVQLEGVYFSPYARVDFRGQGSQVQVAAQFITRKLRVAGNGQLIVKPRLDRAVVFPRSQVELLR